jgi:hypothetical protein
MVLPTVSFHRAPAGTQPADKDFCAMDLAPIQRMRERARQLRRMMRMAHDPEMIELFRTMADAIETDANNLEHQLQAASEAAQSVH